jgi:hypothetical protein
MDTLYGRKGIRESFEAGYKAVNPEVTKDELDQAYQKFLGNHKELQSAKPTTEETVGVVADYFNTFSSREKDFAEMMSRQHRTLQQSFTKAVLVWLEHIAVPFVWEGNTATGYSVDGRNEASQKTAQKLLKGWEMLGKEDEKNTYGMPPSAWLHMI